MNLDLQHYISPPTTCAYLMVTAQNFDDVVDMLKRECPRVDITMRWVGGELTDHSVMLDGIVVTAGTRLCRSSADTWAVATSATMHGVPYHGGPLAAFQDVGNGRWELIDG